jgi:hypothetical protein
VMVRKWKRTKSIMGCWLLLQKVTAKVGKKAWTSLLPSSTNYAKIEEFRVFWLISMIPIQMMEGHVCMEGSKYLLGIQLL